MNKKKKVNWLNNIWVKTLGIAVIGGLVLLLIITISLSIITRHGKEFSVPDFRNMTVNKAQQLADAYSLVLDVTDSVYIRSMERGAISRQNPAPGSKVKKNRRIVLTINAITPKKVKMPDLTGYSLRQAKTELTSMGLKVGKLSYVNDMATNNVISQQMNGNDVLPGTEIIADTSIDLVLGMNRRDNQTFIPNTVGYKYNVAKDIIIENSLNIGNMYFDEDITSYVDSLEAVVYRQIPPASDSIMIRLGTPVKIYLTKDLNKIILEEKKDENGEEQTTETL